MRFLFKEIRKGFISNKAKLQAVETNAHLNHSVVGIKIALVPSSHKFIVGLGSLGERPRPQNCKDFLFQHSFASGSLHNARCTRESSHPQEFFEWQHDMLQPEPEIMSESG